jgi:cell division protein FtsB
MEITKKNLIELIHEISEKIEKLSAKLVKQDVIIESLKAQNESLKRNNHETLGQIKEYVEELEQIRSHYVNSNNNSGG